MIRIPMGWKLYIGGVLCIATGTASISATPIAAFLVPCGFGAIIAAAILAVNKSDT